MNNECLEIIGKILEDVKMIGIHAASCAAPYGEFICTCTPISPETILEKYNSIYIKQIQTHTDRLPISR